MSVVVVSCGPPSTGAAAGEHVFEELAELGMSQGRQGEQNEDEEAWEEGGRVGIRIFLVLV